MHEGKEERTTAAAIRNCRLLLAQFQHAKEVKDQLYS